MQTLTEQPVIQSKVVVVSNWFDHACLLLGLLCVLACLILPLVLIYYLQIERSQGLAAGTSEVTVGVAVLLRATARRLLRSGSSNLLRTALGSLTRASARAFTRRLVKLGVRLVGARLAAQAIGPATPSTAATSQSPLVALSAGFVVLGLSFWGVLASLSPTDARELIGGTRLSLWAVSALAALPLLVYALAASIAGRCAGVTVRYQTALDGVLLQGYFTGAGSFLPMTTDLQYEGAERNKVWVAAAGLVALYTLHVLLRAWAHWTGDQALQFAATMFLIYVFVYSFPIRPLEGHYLWRRSRLLWALFWLPILLSFLWALPAPFAAIL